MNQCMACKAMLDRTNATYGGFVNFSNGCQLLQDYTTRVESLWTPHHPPSVLQYLSIPLFQFLTSMASVYETMHYHKIDRRLYEKLISLGHLPGLARNIVVLWMWLELIGIDVIHYVKKITAPPLLLNFVKEAEAILNVIRRDSSPSDDDISVALPFTAAFATEPFNLRFFFYHKDVVMRGLTYILDGVGSLIFNDQIYHMLNNYEIAVSHANEQRMRSPIMPAELAMQFSSYIFPLSEDHRSLFITFSRGFALRTEEIAEYFNEKTSQCVEKVMMEETAEGVIPMCGRVVFGSEALIEILLNGEHMAKFVIKGREVWGRKYARRLGRSH